MHPVIFKPELVLEEFIIHRAVFSNDLETYYYVVSDSNFANFNIMYIEKEEGKWGDPKEAFFNSSYDDHGMSFSPNGEKLVFSSTRPVTSSDIPTTWHIWMSTIKNDQWTEPEYVEIPNLRSKLVSHPTLSPDGTLYFHASNLDYSDMKIYYSEYANGRYHEAKEIKFHNLNASGYCTPYISSTGEYLIFATIGESLDLYFCTKKGSNEWSSPKKLSTNINNNGRANPYLTPDTNYLFFATENMDSQIWNINWVSTKSFLTSEYE